MALNIKQITNFSPIIQDSKIVDNYYELELGNVKHFGYICEAKGIGLPIYLKTNGSFKPFLIGKTGVFEITVDTGITGIKVPAGISFTIDYIIGE